MKKKTMIATILVGAAAFALLSGFHGGCGKSTPETRAKRAQRMASAKVDDFLDDVDANDDQRTRVHAIKDRLLAQGLATYETHRNDKLQFRAELESEKPNAENVHALVDQHLDAIRTMAHAIADGVMEIHGILTPEQRQEVKDNWPDFHPHH